VDPHLLDEELLDLFAVNGTGHPFDADVDILTILAKDDHIHILRLLDRRGNALEVTNRAQTGVQIKQLAKSYVKGADSTADRCGQGSFDANQKLPEGLDSLVRQPGLVAHFLAEQVEWLFTGIDFHPADFSPAAVDLFDCSIENAYRGLPDIDPGTVAFDERNDRVVRHNQLSVRTHGDLVP